MRNLGVCVGCIGLMDKNAKGLKSTKISLQ